MSLKQHLPYHATGAYQLFNENHSEKQSVDLEFGEGKMSTVYSDDRLLVDLKLAHTYLPALLCCLRTTVLIMLISRQWASENIPLHILVGIFLYADRVIRQEGIFDSNALMSTILASNFLNVLRTDAVRHSFFLDHVDRTSNTRLSTYQSAWGSVSHVALWIVSVLMVLDVDATTILSGRAWMYMKFSTQSNASQSHGPGPPVAVRVVKTATMMLYCILVASVLQTTIDERCMNQYSIMARSYIFAFLSIGWSYVIGVPDMINLLSRTSRTHTSSLLHDKLKKRDATLTTIVQSFVPCQLRFLVVLFMDEWVNMWIIGGLMLLVLFFRLYKLVETPPVHPEYFIVQPSLGSIFECDSQSSFGREIPDIFATQQTLLTSSLQGAGEMNIKPVGISSLFDPVAASSHFSNAANFASSHSICNSQLVNSSSQQSVNACVDEENAHHEEEEEDIAVLFMRAQKAQQQQQQQQH